MAAWRWCVARPWRAALPPRALTRSTTAREDETIAAWGDRVLGASAREWLLEPAMQGIYASPARELSARAIFDGRKRGPRRLAAPAGGMGQFISRLHERLCRSRRSLFVQHRDRSTRPGDRDRDRDAGDVSRSVARAARACSGRAHFGDPHRAAGHGHDVFRSSPRRRARIRRAVSSRQRSARARRVVQHRHLRGPRRRRDPRRGLSAIAIWA